MFRDTYVEASIHCLSEPDMFAVFALAGPPVLARDTGRVGFYAGLSCLHVAEDLDGIGDAADVGVHPVVTWRDGKRGLMRSDAF